jgi:hypothetical protein
MDKASKLLEDMIVSQPQHLTPYRSLTLNPHVIDGIIDPIPSSVDPTLPLESETQAVDLFPFIDPILPLENATQVVDLIPSSVDTTLWLESKPDTSHIFLVDIDTTMLGGIPPSPMEPPPIHEAIPFYWVALTRPRLPSNLLFKITIQVCGQDVSQRLLDEGASITIMSSIAWEFVYYPQLVSVT